MNKYIVLGCLFYSVILFILFLIRPNAKLQRMTIDEGGKKQRNIIFVVMTCVILLCTLPMGLSPMWNGENPQHRNQYEVMAEAILDGHIYLDIEVDPLLLEMENPYDPQARIDLGVEYQWDTAFYNGHYYMYFGVVPVFLVFLPYLILTGTSLTTYHATQIFVAFFIAGVFATFHQMAKRFFGKMPLGTYLTLSAGFSVMSVWYSVGAPALYCTAITSALCMEIWSLYFFMRAVWVEQEQKKTILYAFFGSLFGALAFGCRPPVALANLFVIPMLVEYLRKRKIDFKLIKQLVVAASPYIVIAILLMVYNYVRFDSPVEFGQAYQLTTADQSNYGSFFERFDVNNALNGIVFNFMSANYIYSTFPFLSYGGIMSNYPIMWFILIGLAPESVRESLKKNGMRFFVAMLAVIPLIITVMDVVWSPFMTERYRMDIYWIMGVLCFLVIGFYYMHLSEKSRKIFAGFISFMGIATMGASIALFFVQGDGNYSQIDPEILYRIQRVLSLGSGL